MLRFWPPGFTDELERCEDKLALLQEIGCLTAEEEALLRVALKAVREQPPKRSDMP